LAQIFFAMALAPTAGTLDEHYQIVKGTGFSDSAFASRYLRLNNWDSFHYYDIAERGYQLPVGTLVPDDVHSNRANVAFFPAYPIAARALKIAFGIPVAWGLLLVSQAFAVLFWFYLLLILRESGLDSRRALVFASAIAIYPASFFLVMGYSESMFLAALLGFVYFTQKNLGWGMGILAASHGFILTATRLVGVPLVVFSLVDAWGKRRGEAFKPRIAAPAILIAIGAFLGVVSFALWCQLEFGEWSLYLRLQMLGWGNKPDYLAVFNPLNYIPRFFFEHTVDSINRFAVTWCAGVLGWVALRDWKSSGKAGILQRLGLYFLAFALFYIPLAGKAHYSMDSMLRYGLPVFVIEVILTAAVRPGLFDRFRHPAKNRSTQILGTIGALLLIAIQVWLASRFLRGKWVA
jgi:hypothetical protein